MEGGNGVREASEITQFAEGELKRREVFIPNDEAENHPRMDSALGVLLDGCAVKEKAEAPKNLLNVESPSVPLVRGRSVRRSLFAPLEDNAVAENASGSRTKSAEENFTTKNTNKWKAVMKRAKRTELRSSPKANQNDEKCSYPIDEAETLPRKVSALGVLLDGCAVKKKARVPLTLHSRTPKDVTD